MINTIIFDIGQVLVDFNWKEFIHGLFQDEALIKELEKAIWESRLWNEFDRGVMSDEEVISAMIREKPELEKEIRLTMDRTGETVVLRETTLPWIRDLKARGYRILFLSNYSLRLRQQNSEALCFLDEMDGGVFSYEVHLLKPDPAIYRTICEKYALTPSETVFLDDNADNVDSASAFGLHAIRVGDVPDAMEKLNRLITQ